MKRMILISAIVELSLSLSLYAQNSAQVIYSAATEDNAYLIIINAPEDMESFSAEAYTYAENIVNMKKFVLDNHS